MAKYTVHVNGTDREVDVDPDTPLLWVLRDTLGLTGTKYGCGRALCGTCTILVNGTAQRACVVPVSTAVGVEITTIEGLANGADHPVQRAWIEESTPQCGYCQPGQIMQAVSLLNENPNPSDEQIDMAMAGVLCRCGSYPRIRRAIHRAAELTRSAGGRP